jgi:hypothetical protein
VIDDLEAGTSTWNSSPTDDKTHETAIAIARRCVWIIQAELREEERIEAVREFYAVVREELEAFRGGRRDNTTG